MREGVRLTRDQLTADKESAAGLCMECALLRHDFHELLGNGSSRKASCEAAFPQALIDGRRHTLRPYAWTRQEKCSECERNAAVLYLPAA